VMSEEGRHNAVLVTVIGTRRDGQEGDAEHARFEDYPGQ